MQGTAQNADKTEASSTAECLNQPVPWPLQVAPNGSASVKQFLLTSPSPWITDLLWLPFYFLPLLCHSYLFLSILYCGYLSTLSHSRAFAHGRVLGLADLSSLRLHSCLFAFPDSPVWIRDLSFVCPIFIHITAVVIIDYKHLLSIPNEIGPTSQQQGTCLILIWIFSILHNACYQWGAY